MGVRKRGRTSKAAGYFFIYFHFVSFEYLILYSLRSQLYKRYMPLIIISSNSSVQLIFFSSSIFIIILQFNCQFYYEINSKLPC